MSMKRAPIGRGWVYVITNPAFKDLVKIGYTSKDPWIRAKELESTGMPYQYKVEYEVFCSNPKSIEQRAHQELDFCRQEKEWFKCEAVPAIGTIRHILGEQIIYESELPLTHGPLGSIKSESDEDAWTFPVRFALSKDRLIYILENISCKSATNTSNRAKVNIIRRGLMLLQTWLRYNNDSGVWDSA